MSIACSCNCGNMQIKGTIVPLCINSSDASKESKSSRPSEIFFSIQSQAVKILNNKRHKKSIIKPAELHSIKCSDCGTIFKFYSHRNKIYLERILPSFQSQNNIVQEQAKENQYKNGFQDLINENNINNKYIEEDGDFELMFSNKYYPLIGSYENHMNMSFGESLGNDTYSDFQQMSYLA